MLHYYLNVGWRVLRTFRANIARSLSLIFPDESMFTSSICNTLYLQHSTLWSAFRMVGISSIKTARKRLL